MVVSNPRKLSCQQKNIVEVCCCMRESRWVPQKRSSDVSIHALVSGASAIPAFNSVLCFSQLLIKQERRHCFLALFLTQIALLACLSTLYARASPYHGHSTQVDLNKEISQWAETLVNESMQLRGCKLVLIES